MGWFHSSSWTYPPASSSPKLAGARHSNAAECVVCELFLEEVRMPAFVDQAQKVNRVSFDLVLDVERKRLGAPTRKTMRANMVAALPLNHFTHQARDAFVKIARQALGYLGISCLLPDQIRLEATAENRIHAAGPKTCLKVRPESFPDTRSSSRRVRSALIASSVRESPSRLCTNNFARSARSAGASESASSATARFVIAVGIDKIPSTGSGAS